jgi:hypothetical protein
MKATNNKVIEAWTDGLEAENHTGGLKSVRMGDKLLLVGNGWAVYGYNWKGQFYLFPDWYGYSAATSKHYNRMAYEASRKAGPAGVCINCEGREQIASFALTAQAQL